MKQTGLDLNPSMKKTRHANTSRHGIEQEVFTDSGYQGSSKRKGARGNVRLNVAMRPGKRRALSESPLKELLDHLE